jgi:hypothetical protein
VPSSKNVRRFILAFAAGWTLGTALLVDRETLADASTAASFASRRTVYRPPLHPAIVASAQLLGSLLAMLALEADASA